MPALLPVLLALLPLSCRPAPPTPCDERSGARRAEDELPCLSARAVADWPADPDGTTARLAALPDPALRAAVVEAVIEAHPGRAAALCALIEAPAGRRRCESIHQRPHLWQASPADPQAQADFNGEAVLLLAPGPQATAPPPVAAAPATCPADLPERSCRASQAIAAAQAGDPTGARALCAGIPDPRWQGECHFEAVERSCRPERLDLCAPAVGLCLDAGPFRLPCLVQIAGELARAAPASEDPAPERWAQLSLAITQVQDAAAARDPDLAPRLADRAWATSLLASWGAARQVIPCPTCPPPPCPTPAPPRPGACRPRGR